MDTSLKTGIILFFLGLAGVFSLLAAQIPIELPPEILDKFTQSQIKWLMLINPTIFLSISVALGIAFAHKSGLRAPLIESIFSGQNNFSAHWLSLKSGILFGFLAGLAAGLFTWFMMPFLPPELPALEAKMDVPLLTKFLYGGITEEVLVRWGVMSLLVWTGWKIFQRKADRPGNAVFWTAILLSSLIFGLGHLPILYATLGADSVTPILLIYILVGNGLVGVLAGWLFWKKGLEAAMAAHILAHVGMMTVAYFQS